MNQKQNPLKDDGPESRDATHKFWVYYILLLLFPLILLIAIEAGLRFSAYGESLELFIPAGGNDPEYLRSNPAVSLRYFRREERPPHPQRDYFLKEKPIDGYRVFVLGESTAAGWPYGENVMPSRILARRLSETFPDRNIEVINLAITATNTYTLLDFVDEILEQTPDAVLIYSGHNEFYGALGVGSSKTVGKQRWLVLAYLRLQRFKTFLLLKDLLSSISNWLASDDITDDSDSAKGTLMRQMVQDADIPYGGSVYQLGVNQYENNMREIIGRFKAAGVDVVISELVSNVRDQAPFVSASIEGQESAGDVYERARQLDQAGRYNDARSAYIRAKDLDALRFRAPEQFNEIIHRIGADFDVQVVPMKAYFDNASPNGLVGENLMMEHLHPNAEGYFIMSEAFFDAMRDAGMLAEKWPQYPRAEDFRRQWSVTEFDLVLARLRITHLTDNWPFKPMEISGQSFRNYHPGSRLEALAMEVFYGGKSLLEAHYQLAREFEDAGEIDKALQEYKAMIEISPFDVELYRLAAWLLLKEDRIDDALPILLRAIQVKPVGEAYKWVGQIHLRHKDPKLAIDYFEQALEMDSETDAQLISLLSQAYEQTGQYEKAHTMKKMLPSSGVFSTNTQ